MHLHGWKTAQVFLWCNSKVFSTQEMIDPSDPSAFPVKKRCSFSSPSCRADGDVAGF